MTNALFFLKGMLTGVAIALPVGPIGILCIQRSLARGRQYGLASGLGAATADALYGFIAASGLLLFAESFLLHNQAWLAPLGALSLLGMGIKSLLARPGGRRVGGRRGLFRAFASVFLLTLTNPVTLLSIIAVLVGLNVAEAGGSPWHAAVLMVGIFLGSALWWLLLAGGMGWLHARSGQRVLLWVNRVGGGLLMTFGVAILIRLMFK